MGIELERKLQLLNEQQEKMQCSEQKLQSMSSFERSQRRILEDKMEEAIGQQRAEVQGNLQKTQRQLQSELVLLRDYKVLLREFRKIRLDKLQETMAADKSGRKIRHCVRMMIRHGANRILAKLEAIGPNMEPWMRQALVNMAHLENQLEDHERKLLFLRQ